MTYGRINHPSEMVEVHQVLEVKVLKYDADTQRVSLGYKQIRPDPWDEVDLKYPVGAIVRGRVVSMPDYGAFIELEDGIEGLVHISEMTWNKRIKHPSKLVNMGDWSRPRSLVSTSSPSASPCRCASSSQPWDLVEERYPVGSIVRGKVRNITDFGLFVGIEEGIDGLVHISDLSWSQRVKHPSEVYQKGDEVEARVLNIDRENERFSLSIKNLREDPWFSVQARYFLGQVVQGKVVSRTDFGVFVEIEEGVEGLVHMSEMTQGDGEWEEIYTMGKAVSVEIAGSTSTTVESASPSAARSSVARLSSCRVHGAAGRQLGTPWRRVWRAWRQASWRERRRWRSSRSSQLEVAEAPKQPKLPKCRSSRSGRSRRGWRRRSRRVSLGMPARFSRDGRS